MSVVEGDVIRMDRLERELSVAVYEDERHQRVDAMKKRAVTTAQNYDEFKNLVACANDMLKPVTSAEIAELRQGRSGWKQRRPTAPRTARRGPAKNQGLGPSAKPPRTPLDFERDWRRCGDASARRAYLEGHGVERLGAIWASELDAATLGSLLDVLTQMDNPETWLEAVVRAPRFALSLAFLDAEQRTAVLRRLPADHHLRPQFQCSH